MLEKQPQVRIKGDDEGLDAIEDKVNYKAWKDPTRARADDSQNDTEQSDRGDRPKVLPILPHVYPSEH